MINTPHAIHCALISSSILCSSKTFCVQFLFIVVASCAVVIIFNEPHVQFAKNSIIHYYEKRMSEKIVWCSQVFEENKIILSFNNLIGND